jgi:hypothetical protein
VLTVGPGRADALVDTEDGVVVGGAMPGAQVAIRTSIRIGELGWTCAGVFTADADGVVDSSRDPSTGGDYVGLDAWGLMWSADPPARPDKAELVPLRVEAVATSGPRRAEASYTRAWVTPDSP